jgi:tetratricopeptide (TPR) repeat protein
MMLGTTLTGLDQLKEGQVHLDMAIRLDPAHADARASVDVADGLVEAGKLAEAATHYRRALEQGPEYVPALVGLASILATAQEEGLRDGKEAVALADRACALTRYTDAAALAALAAAHAEIGNFPNAVAIGERALRSARRVKKESLAAWIEQELKRYQRGQPSRRCVGPWPAKDPERSN